MLKTVPVSVTPWRHPDAARACPSLVFPQAKRSNPARRGRARSVSASRSHGGRTRSLLGSFVLVLAVALGCTATLSAVPADAAASSRLDRTERKIVKLVNSYRARHGRARLRASGRLNRVAHRHSRAMMVHDFFAHSSRNGTPATTRVRRSSRARSVGENIAFVGAGERRVARRVVSMWINSPGHRAVLLGHSYRRIGVGRRSGNLAGSAGTAYTADFASR